LEQTPGINIIIIIPVWDPESQIEYNLKNFNRKFEAFTLAKNSKFFKCKFYLEKITYQYWNYYSSEYQPATHSHFIVLSNTDELLFDPEKIVQEWKVEGEEAIKRFRERRQYKYGSKY
jgi:hypothetical protein